MRVERIDNFLDPQICKRLVSIANSLDLYPSRITTASTEEDRYFRTSRSCDIGIHHDPIVQSIDAYICGRAGKALGSGEPLQLQVYGVGEQFKPHYDWFSPADLQIYGPTQRTETWMVYLNTVEVGHGGATVFPRMSVVHHPVQGTALKWSNLDERGGGNHLALHASTPLFAGEKYVLTKWFRA